MTAEQSMLMRTLFEFVVPSSSNPTHFDPVIVVIVALYVPSWTNCVPSRHLRSSVLHAASVHCRMMSFFMSTQKLEVKPGEVRRVFD